MIVSRLSSAKSSWSSTTRALASFLRSPQLVDTYRQPAQSKMATTLWLFVLSMLATAVTAFAALPFVLTSQSSFGGGLSNTLNQPVLNTIIAIVVLGPLIEEIIFRGWLIGTWRSLISTAAFIGFFYLGPSFAKNYISTSSVTLQLICSASGLAVLYAFGLGQSRALIPGFERWFPLLYWGQGIVFGVLHFRNLYSDSIALPLLMTVTIVFCGWLWGYARVVLGLPAALMLHMAYNVPSAVAMVAFMAKAT
jgi:membrane protease YdiL (CAAX protease family)